MWGVSSLAEELSAFQERLCSVDLVSFIKSVNILCGLTTELLKDLVAGKCSSHCTYKRSVNAFKYCNYAFYWETATNKCLFRTESSLLRRTHALQ
jgi:hypothetical protein